jgi:hypothetical protein
MRHPLHFDRSYSAELLRNKGRLNRDRVTNSSRGDAVRGETPGLQNAENDASPLNVTRIS